MEKIHEILQEIKARPKIYLGTISLELLDAFIGGCICYHHKLTGSYLEFLPGFDKFIHDRFDIQSTQGWATIIRFFSESDEAAFYKFYDLLEEFLSLNNKGN